MIDEFDRPNVRWENDFGPNKPMWLRYMMAAALAVFVFGFLAFAIVMGQQGDLRQSAPLSTASNETWAWYVFPPLFALVVLISIKAEAWAIRLKKIFKSKPRSS